MADPAIQFIVDNAWRARVDKFKAYEWMTQDRADYDNWVNQWKADPDHDDWLNQVRADQSYVSDEAAYVIEYLKLRHWAETAVYVEKVNNSTSTVKVTPEDAWRWMQESNEYVDFLRTERKTDTDEELDRLTVDYLLYRGDKEQREQRQAAQAQYQAAQAAKAYQAAQAAKPASKITWDRSILSARDQKNMEYVVDGFQQKLKYYSNIGMAHVGKKVGVLLVENDLCKSKSAEDMANVRDTNNNRNTYYLADGVTLHMACNPNMASQAKARARACMSGFDPKEGNFVKEMYARTQAMLRDYQQVILVGVGYGGIAVCAVASMLDAHERPRVEVVTLGSLYIPEQAPSGVAMRHYMYTNDSAASCAVGARVPYVKETGRETYTDGDVIWLNPALAEKDNLLQKWGFQANYGEIFRVIMASKNIDIFTHDKSGGGRSKSAVLLNASLAVVTVAAAIWQSFA